MSDINMPDSFDEAERFQRLFVKPMVDAVKVEMQTQMAPLVESQTKLADTVQNQGERIVSLESSQSRAMIGWGVFATGASIAMGFAWDYIKGFFGGRR